MKKMIDENKLQIIGQRNKIIAIVLWITLIPALNNQIKTDTSILTMLFIDSFVVIPALFLSISAFKNKWSTQAMYFASIGCAVGFLGGTIDTGMYALLFLSLLLISLYQEWRAILLHSLLSILGFIAHFNQYIHFERPEQYGLFFIMYTLMLVVVISHAVSTENVRKAMIKSKQELQVSKDEMEELLEKTSQSEKKLDAFNKQLYKNLHSTKNISKEIESNFSEITKGVENQTNSINEIHLSLKDVGMVVESVSESSKAIVNSSNETEQITGRYSEEMKKVSNEMRNVTKSIQSIFQLIIELNEKNKDIGDIVTTLNALSKQTNLLALNASIEAARAGEQGKGFAVVASEVKKLSEDSKRSSEEIGSILREIQQKTSKIKTDVANGLQVVENNQETLDQAESIFEEVSKNTTMISTYSDENEQIISVLQKSAEAIIHEMESIAAISEQTSASNEEILTSIENQNLHIDEILSSFEK